MFFLICGRGSLFCALKALLLRRWDWMSVTQGCSSVPGGHGRKKNFKFFALNFEVTMKIEL